MSNVYGLDKTFQVLDLNPVSTPTLSPPPPSPPPPVATRPDPDGARRTWAAIARAPPSSSADGVAHPEPPSFIFTPLPASLTLPPAPPSNSPIVAAMRQAAATGSYNGPNTLIRTVLNGIGPVRTLNPSTGLPDPLPLHISSIAIAPSSTPSDSFSSRDAAQAVLRLGAQPEGLTLPPHVIIPFVGHWSYVYFPAAAREEFLEVLSVVQDLLPDFQVMTTSLPEFASTLPERAAAGVYRRLLRESAALLHSRTRTSVSMRFRKAAAESLTAHAHTLDTLTCTSALPSSNPPLLSSPKCPARPLDTVPPASPASRPSGALRPSPPSSSAAPLPLSPSHHARRPPVSSLAAPVSPRQNYPARRDTALSTHAPPHPNGPAVRPTAEVTLRPAASPLPLGASPPDAPNVTEPSALADTLAATDSPQFPPMEALPESEEVVPMSVDTPCPELNEQPPHIAPTPLDQIPPALPYGPDASSSRTAQSPPPLAPLAPAPTGTTQADPLHTTAPPCNKRLAPANNSRNRTTFARMQNTSQRRLKGITKTTRTTPPEPPTSTQ